MDHEQTNNLPKLYHGINKHFNLAELKTIAFELAIDWEELSGNTKSEKSQALIQHLARRGDLDKLLLSLEEKRPNYDWQSISSSNQQIKDPILWQIGKTDPYNKSNSSKAREETRLKRWSRFVTVPLVVGGVILALIIAAILIIQTFYFPSNSMPDSQTSVPTPPNQPITAPTSNLPKNQSILVLDYENPSIHEFTIDGKHVRNIAYGAPAELQEPAAIAFGSENDIFIGNFNSATIAKYDLITGRWRTTTYFGEMEELSELFYYNDSLYALGNDSENFVVINPETGLLELEAKDCLHFPTSFTVNSSGTFYIGNDNGTICIYSEFGMLIDEISISQRIDGIALDEDENIYISDYIQGKIFRYNNKTSYLTEFVSDVDRPSDLRFDAKGKLYAVTYKGIEAWAPNANYIGVVVQNEGVVIKVRTFEFGPNNP